MRSKGGEERRCGEKNDMIGGEEERSRGEDKREGGEESRRL